MRQLKAEFRSRLAQWYDEREINSLVEWCVCHVLGWGRTEWFLAQQDTLSEEYRMLIAALLERLEQGEPIQYILGEASFCGMSFEVSPSVLIPRPETEELVQRIVGQCADRKMRILDVGTGSGAIAVALSVMLPQAEVEAWDVSEEALQIAVRNNERLGGRVSFSQVDVLSYRPEPDAALFDVIVSNPPYVMLLEQEVMKRHVLEHEPHLALFVEDSDPLLFYREIGALGRSLLHKHGAIFFEINERYGRQTLCLLESQGYRSGSVHADLSGRDRIVSAHKN